MNSKLKDDWQYPFVVVFALRYALRRHSSAPTIVSSYIRDNWDRLKQHHDGILEDIKKLLDNHQEWQEDSINSIDYDTWQRLYTELISKNGTKRK
jgi:hypothetical protein